MMKIEVGEVVRFYNVLGDATFKEGIVLARYPDGIPSCRKPLLSVDTISGLVLESHCKVMNLYEPEAIAVESNP